MVCIYCNGDTQVVNSRLQRRVNQVWRRRKCVNCRSVFSSLEGADLTRSVAYRTSQNKIEPFQRDILFISVYEALKHRKKAVPEASSLTDTIIGKLRLRIKGSAISRTDVITVTTGVLKNFDKAAKVQYLAYHPPVIAV